MSEQLKRRFRLTLSQEIAGWKNEGIIDAQLAQTLAARYPVPPESSHLITILLTIGVVLVGLGVLLFIGANWSHLPRLGKVALLAGAVIGSYAAAWRCRYQPGNHPKLGAALLLLGSLLYGASIWLISQIFNFDTSLENGLMLWSLGTAALTLVTESRATAVLLAILVPAYNLAGSEGGGWLASVIHSSHNTPALITFLVTGTAAAFICARTRSNAALYCLLVLSALWLPLGLNVWGTGMILLGLFLFGAHPWLSGKPAAGPLLYISSGYTLLGCFICTMEKHNVSLALNANSLILLTLALLPTLGLFFPNAQHKTEMRWCLALALSVPIINWLGLIAGNLLFVTMIAAAIAYGSKRQKPALINLALVFAVIDIIARYFDMFFPMLDRSLFFIAGGLLLVGAGAVAEHNRRRLTGSFSQLAQVN